MKRWAWVGAVALVAVVLAFVLFQRPDTGQRIEAPPPTAKRPTDIRPTGTFDPRSVEGTRRPTRDPSATSAPSEADPTAERAWRTRPAATYATRVLAPLSAARYALMKEGSPEARALADELSTGLMADLGKVRASEEEDPLTPLVPAIEAAVERLRGSPWADDPTVAKSLERVRVGLTDFARVKSGEAVEPPRPDAREEEGNP